MSAKKLDQSIFEGLPKNVRFAAVGELGRLWTCSSPMKPMRNGDWMPVADWFTVCTGGWDTTDWQNSLIERQDVPTAADIDWSKAPEGATHLWIEQNLWYKFEDGTWFCFFKSRGGWEKSNTIRAGSDDPYYKDPNELIKRPESINDIARSIEAARVAEKSMLFPDGDARYFETSEPSTLAEKRAQEMAEKLEAAQKDVYARCSSYRVAAYPHYFKDVSAVDAIDLYHVARLYDITDPALFHAFKKIACAGKRGAKDQAQDVQEAIDALKRWQELNV